ncbi:hypothetical protein N7517_010342 [Penicillium concentricum]|uniref:Uncharacterized protein n=1 Tax=Penicillium concentricum TaxID=293559 RepID=A0A9W9USD5_9EURO|nr:uncharacterized protein N7517_010342 [Penicillium concentricum]KAJ5355733.1 hypothetical protein N7517_010342 [Penicillium concentricum]
MNLGSTKGTSLACLHRTITEPSTESDRTTVLKATFDFILKITTEPDDLIVEIIIIEPPSPKPESSSPPRHYRIFP